VSYGLNAATEWKGILEEAVKGAIILAILERLCLTRNTNWLEARWRSCCARMRGDTTTAQLTHARTAAPTHRPDRSILIICRCSRSCSARRRSVFMAKCGFSSSTPSAWRTELGPKDNNNRTPRSVAAKCVPRDSARCTVRQRSGEMHKR
jgi:hypothetical protein